MQTKQAIFQPACLRRKPFPRRAISTSLSCRGRLCWCRINIYRLSAELCHTHVLVPNRTRMKTSFVVLCFAALAAAASADFATNQFMDTVLTDMRFEVTRNGLDPLRATPFYFKVKGNGITNRDLKANFTQGSIVGLAGLVRAGDCAYGTSGGLMMMGCYLSLRGVKVNMNADVKGDSLIGSTHAIATSTLVGPTTFALLEVRGQRGFPAQFHAITVPAVTLNTTVVQGKLELNESRFKEFVSLTHQQLSSQLVTALVGRYALILPTVLSRRMMP